MALTRLHNIIWLRSRNSLLRVSSLLQCNNHLHRSSSREAIPDKSCHPMGLVPTVPRLLLLDHHRRIGCSPILPHITTSLDHRTFMSKGIITIDTTVKAAPELPMDGGRNCGRLPLHLFLSCKLHGWVTISLIFWQCMTYYSRGGYLGCLRSGGRSVSPSFRFPVQ